ncbi:hypothetical protein CapIbe_012826 [Capra ibex]
MERDGSRDSADLCGSQSVCEREKDAREKWRDEDEVRTQTEETDKASSSLVAQVSPVLSYRVDPTPAPARPHALSSPRPPTERPAPGRPPPTPAAAGRAPRAPGALGGREQRASERAREGGAGKVFHEAVAFFRLVFSSLTRVPAPVRVQAGGASTGSPSARGAGTPEPGAGRGAVPAPAHGCSRPARTPSRRAQLARGPSAALCCAPPPPEPGSC